jgi:tRNA1(Val) A37 N6-methylase TrmN6
MAWLDRCLKRLAPGGQLVLIHRADRLPAVLAALERATGRIEIIPLWPGANGQPAKRVIVRCRKGRRTPAALLPGLVLHEPTGKFTAVAEAILRGGAGLDDVMPRR